MKFQFKNKMKLRDFRAVFIFWKKENKIVSKKEKKKSDEKGKGKRKNGGSGNFFSPL